MYKEAIRPAWVEINLSNLDYNIKNIIKKIGPGREIIGVVKADAYGHGSVMCANILRENKVKAFAVATLQEAITLRNAGASGDIVMLGLTPDLYADVIVKYDITPVVCNYENARAFSNEAAAAGKTVKGFIAVDTGMGRIGYLADEIETAADDIKKIAELPNFKIKGLFSHMSTADYSDKSYSHLQEKKFNTFYNVLLQAGIDIPMKTLANSASIMELPEVYFDAVRPGIILYGLYPSDEVDKKQLALKPVMSVKANIICLKNVPKNFSVGYGRKYISEKPSRIATLPLGYADGYPRAHSPQAKVIVNGIVCPVAGAICMDQCMVDVSKVPNVKVGDEAIIMGSDGINSITADDIAGALGTINYEICCSFGQRLPKVYVR